MSFIWTGILLDYFVKNYEGNFFNEILSKKYKLLALARSRAHVATTNVVDY